MNEPSPVPTPAPVPAPTPVPVSVPLIIEPTVATREQERKTQGQRRVNLWWEITQSMVAVIVTTATVYAAINRVESTVLVSAFTLIITLYFVRTNHNKTGGVGGSDSDSR